MTGNLAISRTVSAYFATFVVMVFAPWIYFVYPSVNPHTLLAALISGSLVAFALLPKGKQETLIALAATTLLLIPSNVVGHYLAHVTTVGCYD